MSWLDCRVAENEWLVIVAQYWAGSDQCTLKLDADIELDPIYATLDFIKLHFKSSQNQHKSEKWTNANYAKLSNFV